MNLNHLKIIKDQKRRYFFIAGLLVILFVSIFVFDMSFGANAQGKVQSYSSGDAIVWNDEIYVGSVNTDKLELFKQESNKLIKKYTINAPDKRRDYFYDFTFNIEADILYAYAVNGEFLYKYNLADISNPAIVKSVKDNSWDWFMRVKKMGNNIATVGNKGIKVWNRDMQVINNYANPDKNNKISFSKDGSLIFDIKTDYKLNKEDDFVKIISSDNRKLLANPQIVFTFDRNRQFYFEANKNLVYLIGDRVLKQINLTTGAVNDYRHISNEGFAVDGISGKDYFYFTDGVGIVKMNHELKPLSWQYAYKIGLPNASSCMGLKVLEQNGQEKLVVFNHESVIILNSNLKLVASYLATEKNDAPAPAIEPLSLALDYNRAPRLARINLTGAGFGTNEYLEIGFIKNNDTIGEVIKTQADGNGRFNVSLVVPNTLPSHMAYTAKYPLPLDIKATGLVSGSHYSIGFTIE